MNTYAKKAGASWRMGRVSTTWAKISSAVFSWTTGTPLSGSTVSGPDPEHVDLSVLISIGVCESDFTVVVSGEVDAVVVAVGAAGTIVELESVRTGWGPLLLSFPMVGRYRMGYWRESEWVESVWLLGMRHEWGLRISWIFLSSCVILGKKN